MGWFSRRPVSGLLEGANIPTPSSVMVEMLVLKIAALPIVIAKNVLDSEMMWLDIPVAGNRKLEVRFSRNGAGYTSLDTCWIQSRSKCSVSVGMPGAPAYRSVALTRTEQLRLMKEMMAYRHRCAAQRDADADAKSQEAALFILESLI